jgi:TusA-related sulfurtransferase
MPTTHDHILKEDARPPLTRLLMGGAPSNIAQIIQFTLYIQELSDGTNVKDKLDDYVNQERRVELSFSHFTRLLFELKVAAIYKRRGLSIHFLKKQERVTPDFEVSSPLGKTFVECKRKDPEVKLSRELTDIYRKIVVEIQNDMSQLKLNYSVKVLFKKEATTEDIKQVISLAHEGLIQNQKNFKRNNLLVTILFILRRKFQKYPMNPHFGTMTITQNATYTPRQFMTS